MSFSTTRASLLMGAVVLIVPAFTSGSTVIPEPEGLTCESCEPCLEDPDRIGMAIGGDLLQEWPSTTWCPQGLKGSCDELPNCGSEDVARLARDVEQAMAIPAASALADLVNRSEDVIFTAERGAVQILGCTGEVARHYRIPVKLAGVMTGLVQQ